MPISFTPHVIEEEVAAPDADAPIAPVVESLLAPVADAPISRPLTEREDAVEKFTSAESVGTALKDAKWSQSTRVATLVGMARDADEAKDRLAAIDKLDETIQRAREELGLDLARVAALGTPDIWRYAMERGLLKRVSDGDPDAIRLAASAGKLGDIALPQSTPSVAVQVNQTFSNLSPEKRERLEALDAMIVVPQKTSGHEQDPTV